MTDAFIQIAVERVLNSLPPGVLIGVYAFFLLLVAGRQNSGTKFAVWFSALVAVAGLPFVPALTGNRGVAQVVGPQVVLPAHWAVVLFTMWALIALLATSRIAVGLWKLRRLRKSAMALTANELSGVLQDQDEKFKSGRKVTVCKSPAVSVPTAIGFFQPMILLPHWALQDLSADELRVILLHEFAHIQRWDDWTNLGQKLVRTVFFFHPAVWWIEKRLSLEREMACDDVVLAETSDPRAYATCLVSLAEKNFLRRGLALAQAAIGRARDTTLRLAQILDVDRPKATRVFKPVLGAVTTFAAVCLVVLPSAPRMIAFQDVAPATMAISARNTTPGLPQVAVAPTALRARPDASVASVARRKTQTVAAVQAKLREQPAENNPTVAAMPRNVAAKQAQPATEFLLVMQTTEFDGRGSAVVRFSVWQVRFDPAGRNTFREEVVMKKL